MINRFKFTVRLVLATTLAIGPFAPAFANGIAYHTKTAHHGARIAPIPRDVPGFPEPVRYGEPAGYGVDHATWSGDLGYCPAHLTNPQSSDRRGLWRDPTGGLQPCF